MVLFLNELREFLDENGVSVKSTKNGMVYCYGDTRYSSFKVSVRDPEHYESPYHVMKEGMSGNTWGEEFETADELAEFIVEKQS